MGGLIGVATAEKNGLMSNHGVNRLISKNNGKNCCLTLNIKDAGETFTGFLVITNVDGVITVISVSAAIWNTNRVYCKLINGQNDGNTFLLYIIEENSLSVYIQKSNYAKIEFFPCSMRYKSYLTIVDLIPSNAINIDF